MRGFFISSPTPKGALTLRVFQSPFRGLGQTRNLVSLYPILST